MPPSEIRRVYTVHEYAVVNSTKLVLFFCPFGIKSWVLNLPGMPIWRLRKNGYAVVSYSYKTAIATESMQLTIHNIMDMLQDADDRIADIAPAVKIACFGTSMGTVMASNVAARHPRISKVILNLSYADISDHIVSLPSIRTIPAKKLRGYLITAGSEEAMRDAFAPYSPLAIAKKFHGKKMLVYASETDAILKLEHTKKFHEALAEAKVDLQLKKNSRGGHYFAALVNYLRYRTWLQFLQK